MPRTLDFRLLGQLEVHDGERVLQLGEGRQRSVLALLLLDHDQPVSMDRLVDAIWGERPPATAAKVVQNHVAHLRRTLGDPDATLIRTRGRGYALHLDGASLDVERFERLAAQGAALQDAAPEAARDRLAEALAVWRGPALADLADEPFARPVIARLEERRLAVLEQRIDADLVMGRHAEVVAELDGLVAAHPGRERLRGLLMLALYRSGRQGDALEAYRAGRQALLDELGLEPSLRLRRLEAAILRQDPELEPPRAAWPRVRAGPGRPAGVLLVTGALLLVLAAVGLALRELARDDAPAPTRAAASTAQVVALDPASGRAARRFPAGRAPNAVAALGARLWLVDAEARTLLALDTRTGAVETTGTGATPVAVATGAGSVWVLNAIPRAQAAGPVATEVLRLDPDTLRQRAAIELPQGGGDISPTREHALTVSADAVWAVTGDGAIVRIDARDAVVTATRRQFRATAIAAGGAGVWALGADGSVRRLDPRSGRLRRTLRPATPVDALAVGATAVWATSWVDGRLWRLSGDRDAVAGSVDVGAGIAGVVATRTAVWTANPVAGTVTQVDPVAMRVRRTLEIGGAPRTLGTDGRTVWAAVADARPVPSADVSGVRPVAATSCEPVMSGPGGHADLLVVSDLPLQGDARLSARQMAQAVTFALRERGFRAGRFRVAYQSCDDALAGTGLYDEARCAGNARAYAQDADVVGVIGTLHSGCTLEALPELNRARGGPVAMISPLNSYVGLTRGGPHVDRPDVLGRLYPTGRRNFVRIYPADDLQAGALAQLARDRGRRRAYVLEDGLEGYSGLVADGFETAARRLGLPVVGRARWDSSARAYRGLARRVRAARADAVLVGGLTDANAGQLVRDLRAVLGGDVDLLAPDGLGPPAALQAAAGRAARGVFLAVPGVVTDRLPPAGAAFAQRFARTQPGARVELWSVYAAQAAEALLAAIARSDGTRASVLAQLRALRIPAGLIGPVAFDARGDIEQGAVTILRLAGDATGTNLASADGGVVERVARLSPALVDRSE